MPEAKKNPPVFFRRPIFLCFLSAVLLVLSFPGPSLGFLAWFALIPLLLALRQAESAGRAAFFGFICGLIFFAITLHWMTNVAGLAWLLLVVLEAACFALFAGLAYPGLKLEDGLEKVLWISLAWCVSEFFRAEMPVLGFGLVLMGYSQTPYPEILQTMNTIGAYGLGWLIALVNAILFIMAGKREGRAAFTGILLVIFAAIFSHGFYHLRPLPVSGKVRISVVQGNIPQSVKWEPMARDAIVETYEKLTELSSLDNPDLIIWPEAAYPGYFNRDLDAESVRTFIGQKGVPVLLGAPHLEDRDADIAFNSAYLLRADGTIRDRYDKQILVPFGEYVPLKSVLKWLEPIAYSMGVSNFTPGHEIKTFKIMDDEISFGVLICFEDVPPAIARKFVTRGAQFLAVMTNDAWFGVTAAPFQHLQASIARAVENGVPVVRSANTGFSGFISPQGEILGKVEENGRSIFVTGKKTLDLPVQRKKTLYLRGGWLFPYVAAALFALLLIFQMLKRKKT